MGWMTTRHQQEQVREWLQKVAAGNAQPDGERAIVALQWISELARSAIGADGPMLQIRVRGPLSISEIEE